MKIRVYCTVVQVQRAAHEHASAWNAAMLESVRMKEWHSEQDIESDSNDPDGGAGDRGRREHRAERSECQKRALHAALRRFCRAPVPDSSEAFRPERELT